jgi:hypothetical protein
MLRSMREEILGEKRREGKCNGIFNGLFKKTNEEK